MHSQAGIIVTYNESRKLPLSTPGVAYPGKQYGKRFWTGPIRRSNLQTWEPIASEGRSLGGATQTVEATGRGRFLEIKSNQRDAHPNHAHHLRWSEDHGDEGDN